MRFLTKCARLICEKYHNGGGKEKAAKFYQKNKEKITEKERKIYNSITDIERREKNTKIFVQIL